MGYPKTYESPVAGSYVSVFIEHFLNDPSDNIGILRTLHTDFNLSAKEISELTGFRWARTTIVEALKLNGISNKNIVPHTNRYGERVIGGEVRLHPQEQKVIGLMLELADQGKTPSQISRYLNGRGIKSKFGGSWDRGTVRTIVKRELDGHNSFVSSQSKESKKKRATI